ncbi:MAG TPA: DnaJ domain-containing protein [Beutenbergiaceae bacterium]|nr:DnaJ domain-containing protein [Beutenbergiaceae bacterium]
MPEVNYYEVLGVARGAPPEVIKAAYRAHAKVKHPDREGGGDEFARITAAYQVLSDDEQRRRHDADLDAAQDAGAGTGAGADAEDLDDWGEPIDDSAGWGGPQSAGPQNTGPQNSGPQNTGPQNTGPQGTGPQNTGPAAGQRQGRPPKPDFASQDPRVLAGYDAWANMPVTPQELSWMGKAEQLRQGPPPVAVAGRASSLSAGPIGFRHVALVAWVASCVLLEVSGAATGYGVAALIVGFILGLARAMNLSGCLATGAYVFYYLIALMMVPTSAMYAMSAGAIFLPLLPGVTYGFAVESWRRHRKSATAEGDAPPLDLLPTAAVEQNFQWGSPGGHLFSGQNTFTARNATLGFGGEILTSQLIDVFAAIPGVRVVHGLVPGKGEADVDHVILCGNRVVLVDAKNWAGGDYYWLSGQVMSTTAQGVLPRGNPMHWAVPIIARALPRKVIRPVVVIHSNNGAPVRTNNQGRNGGAELMTPMEFVETIGQWLVEADGRKIDRRALSQLVAWAQ